MNMNPISFGQKIPIARCKVLDKTNEHFVGATLYEYDCKDKTDESEISRLPGTWLFMVYVLEKFREKFAKFINNKQDTTSIYCLTTDKNETIGLCCTNDDGDSLEIKYIEKNQESNYKYAGQNMLAIIGKRALESGKDKFVIKSADYKAESYYKELGFKKTKRFFDLEMDRKELSKFVEKSENALLI